MSDLIIRMKKRTQLERLTIAYSLITSVYDEIRNGKVDKHIDQIAVNIQVNTNRIVWYLNDMANQSVTKQENEEK